MTITKRMRHGSIAIAKATTVLLEAGVSELSEADLYELLNLIDGEANTRRQREELAPQMYTERCNCCYCQSIWKGTDYAK